MSQFDSGKRVVPPSMNIYTVLVLVAFLALVAGVGFMLTLGDKYSGVKNPWHVVPTTDDQASVKTPDAP